MKRTLLTRAQREALKVLYLRTVEPGKSPSVRGYRTFRRRANYSHLNDCLMVRFCGMICGIETDGYTHS